MRNFWMKQNTHPAKSPLSPRKMFFEGAVRLRLTGLMRVEAGFHTLRWYMSFLMLRLQSPVPFDLPLDSRQAQLSASPDVRL